MLADGWHTVEFSYLYVELWCVDAAAELQNKNYSAAAVAAADDDGVFCMVSTDSIMLVCHKYP